MGRLLRLRERPRTGQVGSFLAAVRSIPQERDALVPWVCIKAPAY